MQTKKAPLIFDTETTGLYSAQFGPEDPRQPHVLEIGGWHRDPAESFVLPFNWKGIEIPVKATAVHGIDAARMAEGLPPMTALKQFDALVRSASVLVAHNLEFDLNIMRVAYRRLRGTGGALEAIPKICTMQSAAPVLKLPKRGKSGGWKWPSLDETYQALVDEAGFKGAHDAVADATATLAIYQALEAGGHSLVFEEKAAPRAPAPDVDPEWLEDVLGRATDASTLTGWEQGFIADFVERFEKYGEKTFVSPRQREILERIERERL